MSENFQGILWAILGLFGWGIANALNRIPSQRIGVFQTVFYRNLGITLVTFVIFFLAESPERSYQLSATVATVGLGALSYVSLLSLFHANKIGKIGIVSPIACSAVVITIINAIVFFDDQLSHLQLLFIFVIFLGILLGSINFKQFRQSNFLLPSSGVPFALFTAICWGTLFSIIKWPIDQNGPIHTSFVLNVSTFVFSLLHLLFIKEKWQKLDKSTVAYLFVLASASSAGILGYNIGASHAQLSVVAAITSASPVFVIAFGYLVFGERHPRQHWVGMSLMVAGIVCLSAIST